MFNGKILAEAMNRLPVGHPDSDAVECGTFTNNMISAFDLNEADTSITFAIKSIYSESLDRAVMTALDCEFSLVESLFTEAEGSKSSSKKKNFIVRGWEKFKGWMKSFWNWITRKKSKANSDKAKDLADGTGKETEVKNAMDANDRAKKELKDAAEAATAKAEKESDGKPGIFNRFIGKVRGLFKKVESDEERIGKIVSAHGDDYDKLTDAQRKSMIDKLVPLVIEFSEDNKKKKQELANSWINRLASDMAPE